MLLVESEAFLATVVMLVEFSAIAAPEDQRLAFEGQVERGYKPKRVPSRIGDEEDRHVQEPTPNATQTGHQVRPPAKEDAKTESPGKETDRQEEMMQHPGLLLSNATLRIFTLGHGGQSLGSLLMMC